MTSAGAIFAMTAHSSTASRVAAAHEVIHWRRGDSAAFDFGGWHVRAVGDIEIAQDGGVLVALSSGSGSPAASELLGQVRAEGVRAIERLTGDHGALVIDSRSAKVHLSRDFMGTRPLCWACNEAITAVASEPLAAQILAYGMVSEDRSTTEHYEEKTQPPIDATFYEGVKSVPPDSIVTLAETVIVRQRSFAARDRPEDGEALTLIRQLVDDAVQARSAGSDVLACQTSGGVDSGVIAASAASQQFSPHLITHRTVGLEDDETQRAAELAERHGLAHDIVEIKPPDIVDRVVDDIRIHGPTHPTFWMSGSTIEHAGLIGVDRLLTGHLGDEWLTMAGGPLAQSIWDRDFRRVPAFARDRNTDWGEPWPRTIKAVARIFASGVINNRTYSTHVRDRFVADSWVQRTITSLERAGALHGVQVQVPFADRSYVEAVLGLSAWQRNRPEKSKRILRDAFADSLPASYVNEPMKANFFDAPSLAFDGAFTGADAWSKIREVLLDEWRQDLAKIGTVQ